MLSNNVQTTISVMESDFLPVSRQFGLNFKALSNGGPCYFIKRLLDSVYKETGEANIY